MSRRTLIPQASQNHSVHAKHLLHGLLKERYEGRGWVMYVAALVCWMEGE